MFRTPLHTHRVTNCHHQTQVYGLVNLDAASALLHWRLEELVAPVAEALVAVGGLLIVGPGHVLEPVQEEVAVLLQ